MTRRLGKHFCNRACVHQSDSSQGSPLGNSRVLPLPTEVPGEERRLLAAPARELVPDSEGGITAHAAVCAAAHPVRRPGLG